MDLVFGDISGDDGSLPVNTTSKYVDINDNNGGFVIQWLFNLKKRKKWE